MPCLHIYLYEVDHLAMGYQWIFVTCFACTSYVPLDGGENLPTHVVHILSFLFCLPLVGGIAVGAFIAGLLLGVTCGIPITIIVKRKRDVSDVSDVNTNFCVCSSLVIHGLISKVYIKVIINMVFCMRIIFWATKLLAQVRIQFKATWITSLHSVASSSKANYKSKYHKWDIQ